MMREVVSRGDSIGKSDAAEGISETKSARGGMACVKADTEDVLCGGEGSVVAGAGMGGRRSGGQGGGRGGFRQRRPRSTSRHRVRKASQSPVSSADGAGRGLSSDRPRRLTK